MPVCLHCDRRAELPKLTEVSRKIPSKTRYVSSRSFEVIEFGISRTGIYDFLLRYWLQYRPNFGCSSRAFRATGTQRSKIAFSTCPSLI